MRITKAKLSETIDRLAAELVTAKNEAEEQRQRADGLEETCSRALRDRELALGDHSSRAGLQAQLARVTKEFATFRHEGDRVVAELQARLNIDTVANTSEKRNTQKVLDSQAEEIKSLRGRLDSTVNAHVHATETHNFQIHIKDEKILSLQNRVDELILNSRTQHGAVQGMTAAFEAFARGLK